MTKLRFCPHCAAALEETTMGGAERQRCPKPDCGFIHWNNPTPVVAALVETPQGVILAHNREWPRGVISIITGFLEPEEEPTEAVLREVEEELGLVSDHAELIGLYPFARMNQLIMAYHVKARGEVRLGDELDEFRVIPVEKLKGWNFGTGLAVSDWIAGRQRLSAEDVRCAGQSHSG